MYQGLTRAINLFLPASLLTLAGMITIYSIKPEFAATQFVYFVLAIMAGLAINRLQLDAGWVPAKIWLFIIVIGLVATAMFGTITRGSVRWLTIFGQQIQMSEFTKIAIILFTSQWFATRQAHTLRHTFHYLIGLSLPAYLILRQPDLGTALMIAGIGIIALLIIGTSLRNVLLLATLSLACIPLIISLLQPYQRDRLDSFINPEQDPLGRGYNAAQATIAVGSGQLIGKGLGQGTQSHLKFLPEKHTDFIFASFVEELGFVGGSVILSLYAWLCYTLISIAKKTNSVNHSLVCLLTCGLVLLQVIINIGMNMGIMPITGITLPFMSYGGSSLLSMYLLLGIATGNTANLKETRKLFHIQ